MKQTKNDVVLIEIKLGLVSNIHQAGRQKLKIDKHSSNRVLSNYGRWLLTVSVAHGS